jgi:Tfp pilus assembly protein PilO
MAVDPDKLRQNISRGYFIGLLILGYQGYQTYDFLYSDTSELKLKQTETENVKLEIAELESRISQAREYRQRFQQMQDLLKSYEKTLSEMQMILSDDMNVPAILTVIDTEAKVSGVTLTSLVPDKRTEATDYIEQSFKVSFRGAWLQVMMFVQRLSKTKRIFTIEDMEIVSVNPVINRISDLQASMTLNAYRYKVSEADQIVKNPTATGGAGASPIRPATPGAAPATPTPPPGGNPAPSANPGGSV